MAVETRPKPKLKTAFKKSRVIQPLYTAGPVAVTQDGTRLVSCVGEEILLTDITSGKEICRFSGDNEGITALCISPNAKYLCVYFSSMSLRIFDIPSIPIPPALVQPIRVTSRAHDSPVHVCTVDPTSTYLASGSADGIVKVWDIARGFITHVFTGHGGVVSALAFNYPQIPSEVTQSRSMQLITGSVDTRIRIFELAKTPGTKGSLKPEAVLEGHASVPRGLDVSQDGRWLVSGGRDSVVLIWDLSTGKNQEGDKGKTKGKGKAYSPMLVKTIPILESVEAVGLLRTDEDLTGSTSASKLRFYTGGQHGVVKIWDAQEGSVLFTLGHRPLVTDTDDEVQRQIMNLIYIPDTSTIVAVHADQNILFHSLSTKNLTRQLIGFNDEIVDSTFLSPLRGKRDSHLALASNSSLIRVYSMSSVDARLLEGHSDVVLALDHSADGSLLASTSKDRSARVWAPIQYDDDTQWGYQCVAVCEGHAESIGAVAFSRADSSGVADAPAFFFTGSQDRTIKMWDLTGVPSSGTPVKNGEETKQIKCKSLTTLKAHDKDINSLDVAPNNRLLVSGSQDRTAKIYAIDYSASGKGGAARGSLNLLGVCKGHKRGVWNVRFGRSERVLATGSGDKTVKLWNLDDFSCVKTFEGHTNSVLRVDFLNAGMQLVSSASDGLVKLWNVMQEECVATMDNHEDKVWALAVSSDEKTIVSGAADSVVTFWEDCTEEKEHEAQSKREEMVSQEQDFMNYLALHDYRKAIQLALALEQPARLLSLFREIHSSAEENPTSITGSSEVDEVIRTLAGSDLAKLLHFVQNWNANAKTSEVAQIVLHAALKLRTAEDVMHAFADEAGEKAGLLATDETQLVGGGTALKELIEALVPYTERHLSRMERLVQESYMIDYILSEMDGGMVEDEETSMAVDS